MTQWRTSDDERLAEPTDAEVEPNATSWASTRANELERNDSASLGVPLRLPADHYSASDVVRVAVGMPPRKPIEEEPTESYPPHNEVLGNSTDRIIERLGELESLPEEDDK